MPSLTCLMFDHGVIMVAYYGGFVLGMGMEMMVVMPVCGTEMWMKTATMIVFEE